MAIHGYNGQNFQAFGGQRQQNCGCGGPFGGHPNGAGYPLPQGGLSPFGMAGDPMQQMMQMMMGMMMGMMAGQMVRQMMGSGMPGGQFPPGLNPAFGSGGMPSGGGFPSQGNGMGNFLGNGGGGATPGNLYDSGSAPGAGGPNTMSPPSSTGQISKLSDNKDERIRQVVDAAKRTYPDQPHLAKLAAAQALLESGIASSKGPSGLAKNHNNLFGIKGSGTAGSVNMRTGEHLNGRNVTINAGFAKNSTVEDSFKQHKNLMNKPRYRKVVQSRSFEQAAAEVKQAGYATDPKYTGSLVSIYNTHLAKYF